MEDSNNNIKNIESVHYQPDACEERKINDNGGCLGLFKNFERQQQMGNSNNYNNDYNNDYNNNYNNNNNSI